MFFLSCIIPQPLFPSRFYNMQMNQPHQENTEQVTNKKIPLEPGASEINDLLPKTTPKQRENRQIPTTKQPENHYKTYKNQINKKDDKKNKTTLQMIEIFITPKNLVSTRPTHNLVTPTNQPKKPV